MGLVSAVGKDLKGAVDSVKGAVKNFIKPVPATFDDHEFRARLRVPEEYIRVLGVPAEEERQRREAAAAAAEVAGDAAGEIVVTARSPTDPLDEFRKLGGIFFPYTPTISIDNKAEYTTQTPTHSNYQQYFYKNSSVGQIQVSGKFTVQDESEGIILLATLHLLRSLTKMRFGNDDYAGAPPPICRFDAYGTGMFQNVPVVVASWKHELPDNVDYITVTGGPSFMKLSHVPVYSTITLDLNVVYSRQEMLDYNVTSWLRGDLSKRGYL